MSDEIQFDALCASIHAAVVQATSTAKEQHLRDVEEFIDKEGKPKTVKLVLPSQDPDREGDVEYNVPIFSLVPHKSLTVSEISVDFTCKFRSLKSKNKKAKATIAAALSKSKSGASSEANVNIKFVASDPPEGLARINDRLLRLT